MFGIEFSHNNNPKAQSPPRLCAFLLPFSHTSSKSLGKVCAFQSFSVTLPPNGGMTSVHCGASASWLIGKIEALCSFLQGENLGNFQSLQKF